jgi:hypothetical protein
VPPILERSTDKTKKAFEQVGNTPWGFFRAASKVATHGTKNPRLYSGVMISKTLAVLGLACLLPVGCPAQNELLLTFRGTYYQADANGNIVGHPVTEQTWLIEAAEAFNTTTNGLAIVYHVGGSNFGDTIDVVNRATGATFAYLLGLFFGDPSVEDIGHLPVFNAAGDQERRVDQVFVFYAGNFEAGESLGSAFVTKRFQQDASGNRHDTVEADLNYLALAEGTQPTHMVVGTFTTTRPFVPGQ